MKPDRNAYYHPSFVKVDRTLCRHMRRTRCKGKGPRKPSRPEDQPNFYEDRDPLGSVASPLAARKPASLLRDGRNPTLTGLRSPLVVSRTASVDRASLPMASLAEAIPAPPDHVTSQVGLGISHLAHPHFGRIQHPSLMSMLGGSRTWPHPGIFHNDVGPGPAAAGYPPVPTHYHPLLQPATGAPGEAAAEAVAVAFGHGGRHPLPHPPPYPIHFDASAPWEDRGGYGEDDDDQEEELLQGD